MSDASSVPGDRARRPGPRGSEAPDEWELPAAGAAVRGSWIGTALSAAAAAAGIAPRSRAGDLSRPGAGPQAEGPHADGLRHGLWRIRHPDGSVEEGRYEHGLLHGEWVLRDPSGAVVACETWHLGRAAESGTADCEGTERQRE